MSRLVVILVVIVLQTGCGIFRTENTLRNPNSAENAIVASENKEVYSLGSITCDSTIYNFTSNAVGFYSLIGNKRICLREKAFRGDETANQIIAQIIALEGVKPFILKDKLKFRGPVVFQALLAEAGDHTLLRETCDMNASLCGGTSSRVFMSTAGRLIEYVDGMSLSAYIDAKAGLSLDDMLIALHEHNNTYSKLQYRLIRDAWEKGLIKLKPYGEE